MTARSFAIALASSILLLSACGDSSDGSSGAGNESEANVVDVGLTEFEFDMPEEVTGGTVTFRAVNEGGLPHEIAFGSIEGDRDLDDVMKALQGQEPPEWFEDVAGIPVLSPGVTASMTRDLDEGKYVFLCFLPTAQGKPHALEGMVRLFNVAGTSDAEAPTPDFTITATDEDFDVPEIDAGTHTIELVNDGEKPHEFALFSLEPGKSEKDIGKWFSSGFKTDAPALFPGGLQSIEPGTSVIVEVTLEEGRTYLLQDFENKLEAEIEV